MLRLVVFCHGCVVAYSLKKTRRGTPSAFFFKAVLLKITKPCACRCVFETIGHSIRPWRAYVPTLTRLLLVLALLGALGYGTIYALANFVDPREREITVRVKKDGFGR